MGSIGDNIRRCREAAKLSKVELASRAGVSRNQVYKWEIGRDVPSADRMRSIAAALGTDVVALIGEDTPYPVAREKSPEIMRSLETEAGMIPTDSPEFQQKLSIALDVFGRKDVQDALVHKAASQVPFMVVLKAMREPWKQAFTYLAKLSEDDVKALLPLIERFCVGTKK